MDVWECDLLDVQSLATYNDMHGYVLSVIDVFSKYLHLIPVKTKSGPSVAAAFRSIFHDDTRAAQCVFLQTWAENFQINIFRICSVRRAFSFKFAKIPMSNVRSLNVLTGRSEIECTNFFLSKIHIDI